jgi:hypothetical protein
MKKLHYLLILVVSWLFVSCQPEDPQPIGESFDSERVTSMSGKWEVVNAVQTDLTLPATEPRDLNITNILNVNKLEFTFNADKTFQISGASAPNFIGVSSGKWSFEKVNSVEVTDYPTQIWLNETGSVKVDLGSSPRPGFELKMSYTRVLAGKPSIAYTYTLRKK